MHKRWLMTGVVAVAVAALAVAVVSRALSANAEGAKKKASEVTLEFTPAEVVRPQLVALPSVIEFSGPLVAPGTALVRAKAAGTLLSLEVGEGSRVRAGQTLGRVDLAELTSRVAERNAALDSARAQLAQAQRQHEANQRLADQQFISSSGLEASRAALETARAQVTAAQMQLETSRVGVRDAALVAPISGVIAKRHVLPGEKLSVEQNVLTIVDLARLELAGTVGTHEISQLSEGKAVQVRIEGTRAPVVGKIARIAPAAEPLTRSIGVTVALDNPNEIYRAGQYALASVVLDDPAKRLTVPGSAVAHALGQEHVWLIENGVLVRRAVTTGRRDAAQGRIEVLSGLDRDAQVLAARFDNLAEGGRAVVVGSKGDMASVPASASAR